MNVRPARLARAAVHFVRVVHDPNRLGDVIALSDALVDKRRSAEVLEAFASHEVGRAALADRWRLGRIDLVALRALPEGTFGRAFATFLDGNGLDPNALPRRAGTEDETMYVHAHLLETHDVWHVVTGFRSDVAGELGLQAFYLAQFPARLSALILAGGMFQTLFNAFDEKDVRMKAIVRGWLLGKQSKPFFGMRWSEMWDLPLEEVRARLGIDLVVIDRAVD